MEQQKQKQQQQQPLQSVIPFTMPPNGHTQQVSFGGAIQQLNQTQHFGGLNAFQRQLPPLPTSVPIGQQQKPRSKPALPPIIAIGQAAQQGAQQPVVQQRPQQQGAQQARPPQQQAAQQGAPQGVQQGVQQRPPQARPPQRRQQQLPQQRPQQQAAQQGAPQARQQTSQRARELAYKQSKALPPVKSVPDFIKRRDRLIIGGSTITHQMNFLSDMLKNMDRIKRLQRAGVRLNISEAFVLKTTEMDVIRRLVNEFQSLSVIFYFFL